MLQIDYSIEHKIEITKCFIEQIMNGGQSIQNIDVFVAPKTPKKIMHNAKQLVYNHFQNYELPHFYFEIGLTN